MAGTNTNNTISTINPIQRHRRYQEVSSFSTNHGRFFMDRPFGAQIQQHKQDPTPRSTQHNAPPRPANHKRIVNSSNSNSHSHSRSTVPRSNGLHNNEPTTTQSTCHRQWSSNTQTMADATNGTDLAPPSLATDANKHSKQRASSAAVTVSFAKVRP